MSNGSNLDFKGRVAIVTGAGGGLGRQHALALAARGAKVVVNDLGGARDGSGGSVSAAQAVVDEIKAAGGEAIANGASVTDFEAVQAMVKEAVDAWGRVDILVNNAGIIRRCDALEFSEADWDTVIDVNLKGVFFLSQAVARQFVQQGGRGKIINVASMLSFQGGIRVPSYTASKSGVLGLTRLLANEWAGRGINVNAIAPGYMETDNTAQLREDRQRSEEILARIPAGRWGVPDDLAGAVVFLASAASDYVHGHTLAVDGGWLAR